MAAQGTMLGEIQQAWKRLPKLWKGIGIGLGAFFLLAVVVAAFEDEELPELAESLEPGAGLTATIEPTKPGTIIPTPEPSATPTARPIDTPTATPVPVIVRAEIVRLSFFSWDESIFGIRTHFVVEVLNTGTVSVQIEDIEYKMFAPSGAIIESGDVPSAFPRKIAPGERAVIGRTITADTAEMPEDVGNVSVTFNTKKVSSPDNLLRVSNVEFRGADRFGQIGAVGVVANTGDKIYDNIQIAVVFVDADGVWFGYATAVLPVDELEPGEAAQFLTNADLPASLVAARVDSILVMAYDR